MGVYFLKEKQVIFTVKEDTTTVISLIVNMINISSVEYHI